MEFNFENIATKDWSIVAWGSKGGAITVTHAEGRKSDTLPFIEKRSATTIDPVDPPTPRPDSVDPPKPDTVDPPTPKPDSVDPPSPKPKPDTVNPPSPKPKPNKVDPPTPKSDDKKDRFIYFVENLEESRCFNWH